MAGLPNPFPVQRYRLTAQVTRAVELPEFSGSLLRGVFGHAVADTPLFASVFRPIAAAGAAARYQTLPVPCVIEPPPLGARSLAPGECFEFGLVLMGPARAQLPAIAAAWAKALRAPLGARQGSARLVAIHDEAGRLLFEGGAMTSAADPPATLAIPPAPAELRRVTLDFVLPLCLRHRGRYVGVAELDAIHLARAIVRRCADVLRLVVDAPADIDLTSLSDDIAAWRLDKRLRRCGWERYSSRQQRKVPLAGLLGQCQLEGPLARLWPFFHLGQWLHIGKETVFGFGRYHLTVNSPEKS